MSPEEVAARLAAEVGGEAGVTGGGRWARGCVTVEPSSWASAVRAARTDLGCDFFDWLTAVDEMPQGFAVAVHLWSTADRFGILIRTLLPGPEPVLESIVDVYPGAAWAERETYEMFGVSFTGHPNLAPLLLPPEFDGHPLRKDFILASRVAKAWPGAVEPGESHVDSAARRQPARPPGVPAPGEWPPG